VDIWPDLTWWMPPDYEVSLFYLTNPNAPTGLLFDKHKISDFCRDFAGVVLIDEAYADFARENCMDLALELPNVLVCRTLSKSYSLAGLRLGYLVGPVELIAALDKLRDSYNIDRFAQVVALAAIRDQSWMRANVERIAKTRTRLTRALRELGWEVRDSETNFVWARPPQPASEVFAALRERAIIVRYWNSPYLKDYIRITVGTEEQIDKLLQVLRKEV